MFSCRFSTIMYNCLRVVPAVQKKVYNLFCLSFFVLPLWWGRAWHVISGSVHQVESLETCDLLDTVTGCVFGSLISNGYVFGGDWTLQVARQRSKSNQSRVYRVQTLCKGSQINSISSFALFQSSYVQSFVWEEVFLFKFCFLVSHLAHTLSSFA